MTTENRNLLNIDFLFLNREKTKNLGEVKVPNIMSYGSSVFHEDGLYSNKIFGPVGSELRKSLPGYISLNMDVLHPLIYLHLINLKSTYGKIISGEARAKFVENDFILDENGETGYSFFRKHYTKIKFTLTSSPLRNSRIRLIEKYISLNEINDKWVVIPAGLRDYTTSESGQPMEDEINNLYRSLLQSTVLLKNFNSNSGSELDGIKLKIQLSVIKIYLYLEELLDGKNKFIQGKFSKRGIINGTRNVISPTVMRIPYLKEENRITTNHTVVGLYQYCKATMPLVANGMRKLFSEDIFTGDNTLTYLLNSKTFENEKIDVGVKKRDDFYTLEGISNLSNILSLDEMLNSPVMIKSRYLYLVYDDVDYVKIIRDLSELDESMDRKKLRPLTYAELFYISILDFKDKYPCTVTRYPIAGLGGIYPSLVYVKTTYKSRNITLDFKGKKKVNEYPIIGESYVKTMSPASTHLAKLGADYDGDTCSLNVLYTEESVNEISKFINSKENFLSPDGEIAYNPDNHEASLVLLHLTE